MVLPHKPRGFTLLELLVVIAIIGILASVVLASLNEARDKGKRARAQTELKSIMTAMELLHDDTGLYPHGQAEVCPPVPAPNNEVNLNNPDYGLVGNSASTFSKWNGPYMPTTVDPWGTPYFFDQDYKCSADTVGCRGYDDVSAEESSVIVSCGPDKDMSGPGGSCAYNDDNIVYLFCHL